MLMFVEVYILCIILYVNVMIKLIMSIIFLRNLLSVLLN